MTTTRSRTGPSRRRATLVAAIAAVAGLGLNAVAGAAPIAAATTAAAPTGDLVVAVDRDPGYLDPFHVDSNAGRSIAQSLYDTLVYFQDGDYVPALAESFEVVDDVTIEFVLREGITFHNGEPFNAETVAYNLARMQDVEVNSHYLPQFASVESIEVTGELTFTLHLSETDAVILDTLTHLFIVPPEHTEAVGSEGLERQPVGTGPFTFVSYTADDATVVAANPDYWDGSPKGKPEVATVTFRVIPEATARAAEVTAGSVDVAVYLTPDQVAGIESAGATVVAFSDDRIELIQINTSGAGTLAAEATGDEAVAFEALQDVRVRTALNLAIDREAIVEAYLLGYGSPLGQPFPPSSFLAPAEDLQFGYDPDAARALLEEAGYGDGLTLTMFADSSRNPDLLSLVASFFAEIGVTVEIETIETATFNDGWVSKQFPPLRWVNWSTPEQLLVLQLRTGDLISPYANPDADALLDQQAGQLDPDERRATIGQLAQLTHDDATWVFLWATDAIVGLAPGVDGWTPHVSHTPVTGVSVAD